MARWNKTCVLLGNGNKYQDDSGRWHEGEQVESKVYCNQYTRGFDEKSDPDVGLRDIGELQIRSVDYRDQLRLRFNGKEYDITAVTETGHGEFMRLQIERVISNA